MAAWVFCNRCFQPPRRTACFSLTSCGHVYCDGCLSKGGRGGRPVTGLDDGMGRGGAGGGEARRPRLSGGACPQDGDEGTVTWALWWGGQGPDSGPRCEGACSDPHVGMGQRQRRGGRRAGCRVGGVRVPESQATSQSAEASPGSQPRGPGDKGGGGGGAAGGHACGGCRFRRWARAPGWLVGGGERSREGGGGAGPRTAGLPPPREALARGALLYREQELSEDKTFSQ